MDFLTSNFWYYVAIGWVVLMTVALMVTAPNWGPVMIQWFRKQIYTILSKVYDK